MIITKEDGIGTSNFKKHLCCQHLMKFTSTNMVSAPISSELNGLAAAKEHASDTDNTTPSSIDSWLR
jgi:hypothetical protein